MDFKEKSFLITGGTGTFGKALLKRLLREEIKEVRIFSRDEKKQADMQRDYPDPRIQFMIGDVRDRNRLEEAAEGIDYFFHAAALKRKCPFVKIIHLRPLKLTL